jgi:UDP-glucose/iron transport system ATP-binding protein
MSTLTQGNSRPHLQVDNISVELNVPGREKTRILADVSFTARGGSITAIIGPSGGGKSSLIRLINRLDDPTAGRILLNGQDIRELEPHLLRRQIAMLLQRPFMFPGTVLQNLQRSFIYGRLVPPAADTSPIRQSLDLAKLPRELLDRDARSLSVGQQQRVALARTVLLRPSVLLLDEPTSALDRPTGDQLALALKEISRQQGLVIIIVTHDLRLAGNIADNLLYLEAGKVLESGKVPDIITTPATAEFKRFLAEPDMRACS